MPEKHIKVPHEAASVRATMQALYDGFATASPKYGGMAAGGVTIVDDGGKLAVSLDGTTPAGATPSTYTNWADGGYIVLEGAHPVSGVWQVRIEVDETFDNLYADLSWRGGWANATEFGSVTTTVSGIKLWNDGFNPAAGTFVEMSAFQLDAPYIGSGTLMTGLSVRQVDPDGTCNEAMLCGGIYRPLAGAASLDTHPCALMAGIPHIVAASSSQHWARNNVDTLSRGPVEYAHTTALPREVRFRAMGNAADGEPYTDFSGVEGLTPLTIENQSNNLGTFSPSALMAHNERERQGKITNERTRKTYYGLSFRYNEAA